ncbi:MAG: formimidoylglutamase [Cytophagales bacterium]|nr:formimidoylglutamase [Cytophagales bacterium]
MEQLKIFFDMVNEEVYETIQDPNSFFHHIRIHSDTLPDWKNADIALIGLVEDRGNIYTSGISLSPDQIRKKLYRLKRGTRNLRVADMGNLRNGIKLEDTYMRITEVCEILLSHQVVPVLIGSTHDMDYGQYLAYQKFEKNISITNIDAILDLESNSYHGQNKHHTHRILVHEPNYLFNFSNIGYQTFLNDAENLQILEKLYFENHRIGIVKEKIEDMEPIIRQADMLTVDITAVRVSDAPGNPNATPFGLTGEEICRLMWYAGMSNKLSSLGIYEYNPAEDQKGQTASLIATMIWYFVEGYYNRKTDLDFEGRHYIKYIVAMDQEPHKIIFYKNIINEMWWMEVPFPTEKGTLQKVSVIACSYSDYQTANSGELPNRWISTHAKLM